MLLNYFKLAIRLLFRNPLTTTINVLGLSVGFATFFILWQHSQSALQSDQFHKSSERIVRFGTIYRFAGDGTTKEGKLAINDPELTRSLASEFNEIEDFTRVFVQQNFSKDYIPMHGKEIFFTYTDESNNRNSFVESNVVYADPNLFDFFNFPLTKGNSSSVLAEPYTVVVSESIAEKYFGNQDPLGKVLHLNNEVALKVTGVFKTLPRNTHLSFDIAISSLTIEKSIGKITITNGGPYCYLRIQPGVSEAQLEEKIKPFVNARYNQLLQANCNTCNSEPYLQPLHEVPFNTGYWYDAFTPKSKYLFIVLGTISVLILVMAWINYVNLAISANLKRIKELAARKTVGAKTSDFIIQFIMESFIINFIAIVAAIVIVQMIRYPAESLLQFYIPDIKNVALSTILISLSAFGFGTLFTGLYPAFITLKNSPRVLFGYSKAMKKGNTFSKALTTVQFSFAVILIIWIFSVHLQLDFILNKDLGIRKDQIVTIDLPITRQTNFESSLNSFSKEVIKVPGIVNKTVSNSLPGFQSKFFVIEKDSKSYSPQTNGGVDEQFIPLYEIKLIAGRNFEPENPSNQTSIIISRTTAKQMGFSEPAEAIGQRVKLNTAEWKDESTVVEIIGVLDDYKVDPMFSSVNNRDGIALTYKDYLASSIVPAQKISLLVDQNNFEETIHKVESLYTGIFPGDVFNWNFLDKQIGLFYESEKTIRNQITFFTIIAIGIACLGLLGIIRSKAVERTKEMGIRKVLGAEFHQLSFLLLSTTIRQVIIATVLSIPVATYLTLQYLGKFSERISLQWWQYAVPILLLILIMFFSVASTLFKVNRTNPVDALRYE